MPPRVVRTTYLELTDPAEIRPARHPGAGVTLDRLVRPAAALVRFCYTAIGGDYYWIDRLPWTEAQWRERLDRPDLETWLCSVAGHPAGYVELDAGHPPDVEIAMFGLLPGFEGRGLGGWLLERALRRGFTLGRRVWLHTCDLDAPAALPAYQARGLRIVRTEEAVTDLPDRPPGPWPGARSA